MTLFEATREVTHHVTIRVCHGMVLNGFDSRQLRPPNSETWTKGLDRRMMTKVCDGDILLNERIKDIRFCLDAEWFTSCPIQVVAISSLVKSAAFLASFVWLTSGHLLLTVRCGTSTVTVLPFVEILIYTTLSLRDPTLRSRLSQLSKRGQL